MTVDRSRLPPLGPEPRFTSPPIHRSRLPNGLCVLTVEQPALPVLSFLLILHGGSAADPPWRPGLAALTADMLDEGSGELSAIDIHENLARIGGQFDIEVGPDATLMTLTTLARFRDRAVNVLADMVVRPALRAPDFERVRRQRLHRLLQMRDLAPAVADRAFAELVYGTHPYAHVPIGTEESLQSAALSEVAAFHQATMRPDEATLVAVGDARHDEVVASAGAAFDAWQPGSTLSDIARPFEERLLSPVPPVTRLALVDRPGAAQAELRIGRAAAARDTPEYYALLVLNVILGGQFVSRINMNLREEKGYTYGARTAFDFRKGLGPFLLEVAVQTSVTANAIIESLHELRAIQAERPPTSRELDAARAALTRGYPRNFETPAQIARALGQLVIFDLPDDYFDRFCGRIAAVDAEAVTRAARAYLAVDSMLVLVVGDRHVLMPLLESLPLGPPAIVTVGKAITSADEAMSAARDGADLSFRDL